MRLVGAIAIAAAAMVSFVVAPSVGAQEQAPAPALIGGDQGSRREANSAILDDRSGAIVTASWSGPDSVAYEGGSDGIRCEYFFPGFQLEADQPIRENPGFFTSPDIEALGTVLIVRRCPGALGALGAEEHVWWNVGDNPPAMSASDLAGVASAQLPFPLPSPRYSPPLNGPGQSLVVNLETWIWVDNWATVSRTASAGDVSATVTATPIRLEWNFGDARATPASSGSCPRGDIAYDPHRGAADQTTPCGLTFRQSSVHQPGGTYAGQITVVYEVTWTSNIGLGGNLGQVRRTITVAVPVGEIQAVVIS